MENKEGNNGRLTQNPPIMQPMIRGFMGPMGAPIGMPRPQQFQIDRMPFIQANMMQQVRMPVAFGGAMMPIRIRPPPPKALENPDELFKSQMPLNRPPIDPVLEDAELFQNSASEEKAMNYMQYQQPQFARTEEFEEIEQQDPFQDYYEEQRAREEYGGIRDESDPFKESPEQEQHMEHSKNEMPIPDFQMFSQSERDKQLLADALQNKLYTNYENLSKEEATEVFKQMLRQKGIDSNWKWDDVNRIIQDDKRVKVFKTISERKHAFSDFIYEFRMQEKREARDIKQKRRENFIDMLKELQLRKKDNITYLSKFYQVSKRLQNDLRFKMVDDRDRDDLFQEYIEKLGEQANEDKRVQSNLQIEKFKKQMKTDSNINQDTKWAYIEHEYYLKKNPTEEQNNRENVLFDQTQTDLLQAFEEFVKDLEREEFAVKKQERRRVERKNREKFQLLLRTLFDKRVINHRTKWRDLVRGCEEEHKDSQIGLEPELKLLASIQEQERTFSALSIYLHQGLVKSHEYLDLAGQSGTTPHEYFEDMCKEEKENLRIYKSPFKQLIKSNGIRFSSDVTFPSFNTRLEAFESYRDLNTKTKILLHEYYQYKIGLKEKEKEREKERKLIKEIKAFIISEARLMIDAGQLSLNGIKTDQVSILIDDKLQTQFGQAAPDLKLKANKQAVRVLLDQSDSSSSQSAQEKRKSHRRH